MRFAPYLVAFLAAAVSLAFTTGPLRSDAQSDRDTSDDSGTPATTNHRFVGAWRVTFDTPMGPSQSLLTVMADGTVLFSGRPVSPAAGPNPTTFSSAAHGAWEATGPDTAATTWIGLVTDVDGNFLAVVTDSVEATLDESGNAWRGQYSASVADPNGNVLYVGGSTVEATRITVQPLATPAATPASA